ncbi:MAG: YraN family protein [Sphaerochaetaceae bacterium]|nr:YraN family protein [Sphaerochaetaceae bacterium]
METIKKGQISETLVVEYLQNKGFVIVQRNYHCPYGEIDILATLDEVLHVVEVKTIPKSWNFSDIESMVGYKKRSCIKKALGVYLSTKPSNMYNGIVFDVATVKDSKIRYYEGAF